MRKEIKVERSPLKKNEKRQSTNENIKIHESSGKELKSKFEIDNGKVKPLFLIRA